MRPLPDLINALREYLAQRFAAVRISSLQTGDQLLSEIKAINPDKLPGVIIVFDRLDFSDESLTADVDLTLVLVDRFRAGSDDKALSLFQATATLLDMFPADGLDLGGFWISPVDCASGGIDSAYAALALGIRIRLSAV